MFKLFNLVIVSFLLLTTYSFAQSIFDPAAPAPTDPTTSAGSSMSAEDFKNAVTQRSQQTKNNLNQQAKDLYPKTPPKTAMPPGSAPAALPPPQQPNMPSSVDNSFSVNGGGTKETQPSAPAANQSNDGYSGFGGGTKSNKSSAPASSGNSGGWNINY